MDLASIYTDTTIDKTHWIVWDQHTFIVSARYPKNRRDNRETLARSYKELTLLLQNKGASFDIASRYVRAFWIEEYTRPPLSKTLPCVIGDDSFMCMYALGLPLSVSIFRKIYQRVHELTSLQKLEIAPLYIEWNDPSVFFYDVDATPPGILPKLSSYFRLKKDQELLKHVASDLEQISSIEDPKKRMWLSLAVLSHGAAYRELENLELWIPSFIEMGKLNRYTCHQHLIAEGLKTVSLVPDNVQDHPIYLCQGTELWPSQPSALGSIIANFATHGSATQAYAHSWRRIHKHLRDFARPPLVTGHSMGGALALQIALYSHRLIDRAFAFNPPVPNERDYLFYHQMAEESKEKIQVMANLDDFAFWRIGAKVIGNVTLFLTKVRWKYYAVTFLDCVLLIPAFVKFIRNVRHAFPAHQNIAALYENWVWVKLSQEEIEKENLERITRFDYLHFLPKLYDPMTVLLGYIRKIFKWRLEKQYLRNEIELLALHERDLLDTLTEENKDQIAHELQMLAVQKKALIQRFKKH